LCAGPACQTLGSSLWTGAGHLSEILAFDSSTQTLWVSGVTGADVLSVSTEALVQHINTTA
jgi:hypothetical protein